MGKESTTINVKNDTYEKLENRKRRGQSFDGVINELLEEE